MGAVRKSQMYAENATHDPNTIRYARPRRDAVLNRSGWIRPNSPCTAPANASAVPPASISMAVATRGRAGRRAPLGVHRADGPPQGGGQQDDHSHQVELPAAGPAHQDGQAAEAERQADDRLRHQPLAGEHTV